MSKRKNSGFGVIIVIVLLLYFAYSFVGQQKILYSKSLEMERILNKISEETKVNKELEKQKETIDSDEYVEKVAREKLGMVKKDERVFVDVGK